MSTKTSNKETESHPEGVVTVRRVVSRPMSWQDGAKRQSGQEEARALEAENPNAPEPTPSNEYIRRTSQLRRRHKADKRSAPNYMSDIKL